MEEGGGLWFSRRALTLHAIIIVIVATFAALCIWQVHRALDGNSLSWAYVFEWPFFAGYAIYMWWRFVHEDPATVAAVAAAGAGSPSTNTAAGDRPGDPSDPGRGDGDGGGGGGGGGGAATDAGDEDPE